MNITRNSSILMRTLRHALLGLAMVCPILSASTAHAQVVELEDPYYAVVSQDGARLWAGDADIYYAITDLEAGQILQVDGESDGYLRVGYPSGTPAFVRAEEAQLTSSGDAIRLVRDSNLRAVDPTNITYSGCWKSVFYDALPVGTELGVIERVESNTGTLEGYLVRPPDTARGFVFASQLRSASQAEVDAHLSALAEAKAAAADAATDDQGETGIASADDEADAATDATAADDSEPAVPNNVAAIQEREPDPVAQHGGDEPLDGEDAILADLESLDNSYEAVMAQPVLEAEYGSLIGEYEAMIERADDETPTGAAVSDAAATRVEALRIQQSIQQLKRDITDLKSKSQQTTQEASSIVKREGTPRADYLVVGRLVPSAVYSGDRLPLLYRVVSVSRGGGRTLAYLLPDGELGLERKAGSVVGVIGERPGPEPSLIGVVDATRVDVLEPGASQAPSPTEG